MSKWKVMRQLLLDCIADKFRVLTIPTSGYIKCSDFKLHAMTGVRPVEVVVDRRNSSKLHRTRPDPRRMLKINYSFTKRFVYRLLLEGFQTTKSSTICRNSSNNKSSRIEARNQGSTLYAQRNTGKYNKGPISICKPTVAICSRIRENHRNYNVRSHTRVIALTTSIPNMVTASNDATPTAGYQEIMVFALCHAITKVYIKLDKYTYAAAFLLGWPVVTNKCNTLHSQCKAYLSAITVYLYRQYYKQTKKYVVSFPGVIALQGSCMRIEQKRLCYQLTHVSMVKAPESNESPCLALICCIFVTVVLLCLWSRVHGQAVCFRNGNKVELTKVLKSQKAAETASKILKPQLFFGSFKRYLQSQLSGYAYFLW
ncbi:NSF attachment protein [Artemisia annua]|uniref:NSF attachment protein n=1 Tax=Artemisia annua TaxID=35608 RepID=A0A2U1LW87_ARTAN|nr:NSF attachment protein [Artemisia annua]